MTIVSFQHTTAAVPFGRRYAWVFSGCGQAGAGGDCSGAGVAGTDSDGGGSA